VSVNLAWRRLVHGKSDPAALLKGTDAIPSASDVERMAVHRRVLADFVRRGRAGRGVRAAVGGVARADRLSRPGAGWPYTAVLLVRASEC
jgi:hypothetical protein